MSSANPDAAQSFVFAHEPVPMEVDAIAEASKEEADSSRQHGTALLASSSCASLVSGDASNDKSNDGSSSQPAAPAVKMELSSADPSSSAEVLRSSSALSASSRHLSADLPADLRRTCLNLSTDHLSQLADLVRAELARRSAFCV